MTAPDLVAKARAWLAQDPDPETRRDLERLLQQSDQAGLADRFGGRLEFGTAGLRGPLGAGPNRMNRLLVRRATAGLARYLHNHGHNHGRNHGHNHGTADSKVVIGYDARHKSDEFAAETATVLASAGVGALVLPRPLPTPLLAYAVRRLGAAAGVMITASHNPRGDNGFKVYLDDGAQIIPPVDHEISAEIDAIDMRGPSADVHVAGITTLDEGIVDEYVAQAVGQSLTPSGRDVGVVYTPMHGVGGAIALKVLADAGFDRVTVVEAQAQPDPQFPTLAFPNPEEPGALDLAIADGRREEADLVLANDPDADRLGVAVPTRDRSGWRPLRGDEIGVLLADHVLRHTRGDDRLVATTIVSSSLLSKMAKAAGVHYVETLTGFKWIARAAGDRPNLRFVFGYEEALGYCAGTMVRDKDGITAALLFAELVANLRSEGVTVHDRLDELAALHGAHMTDQWSIRLDAGRIAGAMARLRSSPPAEVGGWPVVEVDDLLAGGSRGRLPPSDVVVLRLGDHRDHGDHGDHGLGDHGGPGGRTARVIVRPSGTEPKLKVYFEAVEPVEPRAGSDVTSVGPARAAAAETIRGLRRSIAAVIGAAGV